MNTPITLTFELTPQEAMAVSQFVKRLTFTTARTHATSDDETYRALDGLTELSECLAKNGFDPR